MFSIARLWVYAMVYVVVRALSLGDSHLFYQTGTSHLAGASVTAGLSTAATGASTVLTSAVTGTVAWDTTSSETAAVVSASITAVTLAVLSACTTGAAVAAGAAVSVVLKLDHNESNYTTWLDKIPGKTIFF